MTDTAVAAAPAAPAAAAPAASPAPAAPSWHDTLDPTVKTWAAGKGYDLGDPAKIAALGLQGHMNAEKMIGADRAGRTVVLPSDEADVEGWGQVHKRMGRPDAPAQYDLPVPEGDKGEFAKLVSQWLYDAGIPKKAGQHIAAKWNEHVQQAMQAQQQAEETKLAAEHQALERDWGTGDAAAVQREMARRGAQTVGLDETAIDALQKVSGYTKTMKALAKIGEMTGEKPAVGMDSQGGFRATTPEQAAATLKTRSQDKEWGKKAMAPGTPENSEWKRLRDIVATAAAANG